MPCPAYTDPRLAAVYDTLNPPGDDYAFYLGLAGDTPLAVLDMGCGTGRLSVAMAARGHGTTGADPAAGMLGIARAREGAAAVTWVEATAGTLDLAARFDLIVMTGHVFQVFLDDGAALAALANLRRHLAPGGRIAFETRNPAARDWETWTPEETRETLDVPGIGAVEVHYDIAAVDGEHVTYETHFRFAGGHEVATSTLRFMGRRKLEELLTAAGLEPEAWHGDWDGSPPRDDSPEIVVIARAGGRPTLP